MANKEKPKGQRPCRCPLGCHSGHLSAREQGPPFQRLAPCAGRQRAEHPVLNAVQQQGFEALRQGMAPSANQQAELHSLWEKAPGYVPAHRGGWGEVPAAPAAAGAAQDAGEAARRQAFLKWTQGEAMTAQEKALVEDLWNTDPHRASEYWAAGEFLDTGMPTSSALDGGGLDGTMKAEAEASPAGQRTPFDYLQDSKGWEYKEQEIYKKSPYAYLNDSSSVGEGKAFTRTQKRNIIQENRNRNHGVVRSDFSGKELIAPKKSQRGIVPPDNEWQIDHIYPRDKGGTNSYANAQVLSRKENRQKWNRI